MIGTMEKIKVSVIIPIYNMEKYLPECLESVFRQTLDGMEVICIDDGSTDHTKEILEKYQSAHDNMYIIYQNRQGAGIARNKGIDLAKGEFIAFMDSDDYYPSNDVLEYLYNGAIENKVSMAGGNLYFAINGINTAYSDRNMSLCGEDRIVSSSEYQYVFGFTRFIYYTNMLKRSNIKFPDFVRCQDPPFMLDTIVEANKIWLTSKYVYVCRAFDKKIEFTSKNVIGDIANAYLYMMDKSKKYGYKKLQKIIINKIDSQEELFLMHLINGNDTLPYIFDKIGSKIIENDIREFFVKNWDKANVKKRYLGYKRNVDDLNEMLQKYRKVLIYGAGEIGKQLYDYISSIENVDFLGFAVTNEKPEGTARGYEIKPLSQYREHAKSSLVIIAIKNDTNNEMHDYAQKIGFEDILCVNNKIGYIGLNKITDGKYAFDN